MIKFNLKYQILNFIIYVVLQLLMINSFSIFNIAFGFMYVGFIFFLPHKLNTISILLIAFLTGLVVDLFSNTLGIHTGASVLFAFLRNLLMGYFFDDSQEQSSFSFRTIGLAKTVIFLLTLTLSHHFYLFIFENEGFQFLGDLILRIFASTILSSVIVLSVNLLFAPKLKRL